MNAFTSRSGFTIVELLIASMVTSVVLGGAATGIVALQRSFGNSKHYAEGLNDGCRLADYICRDLRNAIKVSRRDVGVVTSFKTGTVEISETTALIILEPNYFVSNVPGNATRSDYKLARFSRSRLPAGEATFPYLQVVTLQGVARLPNYPGEVEVRYSKKRRLPFVPTLSVYRETYEGGVLQSSEEIAEEANTKTVAVAAIQPRTFQVITSFRSKWSDEGSMAGTRQFATVKLLNPRRD